MVVGPSLIAALGLAQMEKVVSRDKGRYSSLSGNPIETNPRLVGDSDAVFIVRAGGTLQNVIIGKNQKEGVHCDGPCTLKFVWFEDVCEDAITIVSRPTARLIRYTTHHTIEKRQSWTRNVRAVPPMNG